jgi:serine/threonine protein kinase
VDFRALLGEGASGSVYVGRHLETDREVAIKTVLACTVADAASAVGASRSTTGSSLASVQQERDAVSHLLQTGASHPHVVECLGWFESSGKEAAQRGLELPEDASKEEPVYYFVYELLDGQTLADRIQKQDTFDEKEAKGLTKAMCEGLSFLHKQGVVHRDIKPANVLFSSAAPEEPKLIDFSCAGVVNPGDQADAVCFDRKLGTAGFVAPEVLSEREPYNAKCDVYSLGCTVHSMLAKGRLPRRHPRVGVMTALPDSTSSDAVAFLDSVLAVDPRLRPSVEEVLQNPWLQGIE